MKRRVRKLQGGGMDASKGDFGTPSGNTGNTGSDHSHSRFDVGSGYYGEKRTTTGGGGRGKPPGPTNVGKDVPFEKPVPNIGLITGLINLGAYANYKGRQNYARKQGLYKDHYKSTGKPLQPNSPIGKEYLKDAGYGKTPEMKPDRDGKPIVPPPAAVAAKPVTAVQKPFKPYYMGFDFQKPINKNKQRTLPTDSFKRGGLSGGKRFGPPPKKGPNPHGTCPHRKDGIRGVGAVERGRGVKFVGVK